MKFQNEIKQQKLDEALKLRRNSGVRLVIFLCSVIAFPGIILVANKIIHNGEPSSDSKFNRENDVRLGIDVSHAQGAINWTKVGKSGVKFANIKATEGGDWHDPNYSQNYKDANAELIYTNAYHFANPVSPSSGYDQAQFFINASGDGYFGWLDLENPVKGKFCYGLTQREMINWINDFFSGYYQAQSRTPGIYTRTSWWDMCVGNVTWVPEQPYLWISHFTNSADPGKLPNGFTWFDTWQYSQTGKIDGVKTDVDLNRRTVYPEKKKGHRREQLTQLKLS